MYYFDYANTSPRRTGRKTQATKINKKSELVRSSQIKLNLKQV